MGNCAHSAAPKHVTPFYIEQQEQQSVVSLSRLAFSSKMQNSSDLAHCWSPAQRIVYPFSTKAVCGLVLYLEPVLSVLTATELALG